MIKRSLCVFALTLAVIASPAMAQDFTEAEGGVLRWLDKLTGETADIELTRGQEAVSGRLTIRLDACRYPTDNALADAEGHLTIKDANVDTPVFDGWMVASAPALSALDHPRYDVWVLRCILPEGAATLPAVEPDQANTTSEGEGQ